MKKKQNDKNEDIKRKVFDEELTFAILTKNLCHLKSNLANLTLFPENNYIVILLQLDLQYYFTF